MVKDMGEENGFLVDDDVSPGVFTDANLEQYSAVFFLNTGGDFMNEDQKAAFQNFIRSGKGYVGTHSADFTLHAWDWYHEMLGSKFQGDFGPVDAILHVVDNDHASTRDLPDQFTARQQLRRNEFYFNENSEDFRILITADPSHYNDGRTFLPYVYTHEFETGRIWYGAMGHTDETFTTDENMKKCILGGILYALGRPGSDGNVTAIRYSSSNADGRFSFGPAGFSGFLNLYNIAGKHTARSESVRGRNAMVPLSLQK